MSFDKSWKRKHIYVDLFLGVLSLIREQGSGSIEELGPECGFQPGPPAQELTL